MNFSRHFDEYDNYSSVQKKVAENLVEYMKKNEVLRDEIHSIFEVGCGTGIFTRKYIECFSSLKNLTLNDRFDVRAYINDIDYSTFIEGDILDIDLPQSDLLLSSSVFQWIYDSDRLFKNIKNSTKKLCFSTYILGNLIEIKNHFGLSLEYKSLEELEKIIKKYFKKISFYKETIKLDFENPIELLRHLKYTGVTGLQKPSVNNVRTFKSKILTYEVAYFICEN